MAHYEDMRDCIFCRIVQGEIPCAKLYETEHSLAFLDIAPLNRGHSLVIPKRHYADIFGMPGDVLADIIRVAGRLAPAIKTAAEAEGLNLIQNNGKVAHQFVMHFHLHLIPRFKGDAFGFNWPAGKYGEGEMKEVQNRIVGQLNGS